MVSLKVQKRLAASVMKNGKGKVWLDPNESSGISMANSPQCLMTMVEENDHNNRLDMHIELSYSTYEAFKILAKNYLDLDDHDDDPLFKNIKSLLKETEISLNNLIKALEEKKSSQSQHDEDKKKNKF
ncbi:AAA-ATPase At5g40000-like [Raphanus sativus]|uniref:AAA-ATPase At5g40000-like n=1 Tax=Raphanus sativus TaxID=3726 RepID=A0A6J0N593_RAPSA|nr:AAA-ATPase At5g40000-like [Raphanus sativus]